MTAVRVILNPVPASEDRWIKLATAAEILAMTKTTVRKLVAQGHLQAFRVPSGELRFREADVLALLTPVPNPWTHQVAIAAALGDTQAVREIVPVDPAEVVVVQPVAADLPPIPSDLVPVPADEAFPPGEPVAQRWPAKEPAEPLQAPVLPSDDLDGPNHQDGPDDAVQAMGRRLEQRLNEKAAPAPAEGQDGDPNATPAPEPVGTGTAYAERVRQIEDWATEPRGVL